MRDSVRRWVFTALALASTSLDLRGAQFDFINLDSAGEGLNDPTAVTPVGGNPGTTRGAQRLAVLQRAGEIWGSFLVSSVPIRVNVKFDTLGANTLAGASTESKQANFINAPQQNVWYPIALANSLAGVDLEPGVDDISITASSDAAFYYGLDSASPSGQPNFVDVLLHELGHGLGFISFVNASNGTLFLNQIDVFSSLVFDRQSNQFWQFLTSSNRASSARGDPNLVWTGPFTTAGLSQRLSVDTGITGIQLRATLPGPFVETPAFTPSSFGPALPNNGLSGDLVITDTGATPPADSSNACGTIINSVQVAGNIAFVRRGICEFDSKVFRAQQAGAVAAIIADNMVGNLISPSGDGVVDGLPVTLSIPSVFVSKQTGDTLLAASPGVPVSFVPLTNQLAGTNGSKIRLHAPSTFSSGSSVSHWTTETTPNLVMEPIINPNFDRKLDLTLTLMKDIGWKVVDIPFPHLTFDSWKTLVFSSTDSFTNPADDPDSDGVSNQEEYFFGNNPKVSDAAKLPIFRFAAGQKELVFTRSKLTTDLSYALEKSTTLVSFQPATVGVDYQILSTQSLGTDAETITLRLLNPPANFFLRLRIQRNP